MSSGYPDLDRAQEQYDRREPGDDFTRAAVTPRCPYCRSTHSSLDDGARICEGCGAVFEVDEETEDD